MPNPNVTVSPAMSLPVPDLTDPGPDYATNCNASLNIIDGHTHTGAPTDGLQIDLSKMTTTGDVELSGHNLGTVRSVELENNLSNLTGSQDVNCICVVNSVLGFNNSSGTFIPLSGPLSALLLNMSALVVTTSATIAQNSPYNLIECNPSAPMTLVLPVAAAITPSPFGRFFVVKDISGTAGTNNITVSVTGASADTFKPAGTTTRTIQSNGGYLFVFTDGISGWYVWGQTDFSGTEGMTFGGTSTLSFGNAATLALAGALNVQSGALATIQSGGSLLVSAAATFQVNAPVQSTVVTAYHYAVGTQALNSSGTTAAANSVYSCPIIHLTGTLTGTAEYDLPSVPGAVWVLDWSAVILGGNTLNVKVGTSAARSLAVTGTQQFGTTPALDSVNLIICPSANLFLIK